jgi:PD-(D/E)XK endonuclease
MKKKSRKSPRGAAQDTAMVRGPLKTKEKGELAELAFLHKAASLGFGVARPHGDSERYDFIVDNGERFWRVQVKSIFGLVEVMYRLRSADGRKVPYTAKEIDFIAAYIAAENIWYIIPLDCAPGSTVLAFYPSGRERGCGCFEKFREAWHLMAPGADLPQPGRLRQVRAPDPHRKRFVERADDDLG